MSFIPKGSRFYEDNFSKLVIESQPITEERSEICGGRGHHSINLNDARNCLRKICHFCGKGYFTAVGASAVLFYQAKQALR